VAVQITAVEQGSPAAQVDILPGDTLCAINGHSIEDVLDYRFYMMERSLQLVLSREGKEMHKAVHKGEYEELGLEFETYLMDSQRTCYNKCIFCFVDQMPPGMRESLYFKDDDSRLSFLFGNYITLTNLKRREIDRIKQMHISPINISVHTMNPGLREKMMCNRFAGEALGTVYELAQSGIKLNTQLVLCPGINDGEELRYSLKELLGLYPGVQSVACVPVGLTKYREGLPQLEPYTRERAAEVVRIVEELGDKSLAENGERVCYASDEFYLRAGLPIPPAEFYGEFNQLENGVGLVASLEDEFSSALALEEGDSRERRISLATGVDAAPILAGLAQRLREKWPGVVCTVYPIVNDFFGHTITVAGLVTGKDLLAQLAGRDLGEELLIPSVMLRHEQDKFLDDVTLEEAKAALGVPIRTVENDGFILLAAFLGEEE
jgi:putative radical SAM enzyme (TIGR03279 family)